MSEWKSITSAPKDGTRIDIWVAWTSKSGLNGKRIPDCYWHKKTKSWHTLSHTKDGWCQWRGETATHWMPLPTPPSAREES